MELRSGIGNINKFEQLCIMTKNIVYGQFNCSPSLYFLNIFPSSDAVDTQNGKIGKTPTLLVISVQSHLVTLLI